MQPIQTTTKVDHPKSFSLNNIPSEERNNPLYIQHFQFLQSITDTERNYFFADESTDTTTSNTAMMTTANETVTRITSDNRNDDCSSMSKNISTQRRSEIWDTQCTVFGEACVQQYTIGSRPIRPCLKILHRYTPLIEIGCVSNAYWCQRSIVWGTT
jgi:hypothetical protein